jgi:multidrug efflux pump subunit AcrB
VEKISDIGYAEDGAEEAKSLAQFERNPESLLDIKKQSSKPSR